MPFSIPLLRQPRRRHYALLDEQRLCRMLLTAEQPPSGELWVEVPEICLQWIGRPVPGAGTSVTPAEMPAL